MSSIVKGVQSMKQALKNSDIDDEINYLKAIEHFNSALRHFTTAIMNDEITIPSLKEEVKYHIEFCMKRSEEIIVFQNQKKQEYDEQVEDADSNLSHDNKVIESINPKIRGYKPNLRFADVCGMEMVKTHLIVAVIFPIKHPQLFTKRIKPYKGFLFFGPPGTGKTSIAKAVAEEANCSNFYQISAADVLSKYIGKSETLVREIFEVARRNKPSVIFIDEIDALAQTRSANDSNRCMKTELFVQMEGINDGVFVMAARNTPYDLDDAILRRFDKLIYVRLPEQKDRFEMFRKHLSDSENVDFSEENLNILAARTKGFSFSDIDTICKKANLLIQCEAVVEGMDSVLSLYSQNRTRLEPKTVERETIIRWQGPHPGKGSTKLIEASLDNYFNGRDKWHFVTKADTAKYYMSSKVINRVNESASKNDKIPFK